jgi:hypothetical protein
MTKVERIARGRTRRAEAAMYRQVLNALAGLRADQSPAWLEMAVRARREVPVASLPNRLAGAVATVRKAFLSGYKDGRAVVNRG